MVFNDSLSIRISTLESKKDRSEKLEENWFLKSIHKTRNSTIESNQINDMMIIDDSYDR